MSEIIAYIIGAISIAGFVLCIYKIAKYIDEIAELEYDVSLYTSHNDLLKSRIAELKADIFHCKEYPHIELKPGQRKIPATFFVCRDGEITGLVGHLTCSWTSDEKTVVIVNYPPEEEK